eukprot:326693-Prymnesium_polylepis.1
MRCAELLEYGYGTATGLGWHWDVGSTLTMVAMLYATDSSHGGELQLSTVPLQRGRGGYPGLSVENGCQPV